jgi:hypothetical protein
MAGHARTLGIDYRGLSQAALPLHRGQPQEVDKQAAPLPPSLTMPTSTQTVTTTAVRAQSESPLRASMQAAISVFDYSSCIKTPFDHAKSRADPGTSAAFMHKPKSKRLMPRLVRPLQGNDTTTTTTTTSTPEPASAAGGAAADPGAVLGCKCGKTKIKYTCSKPRMRLECGRRGWRARIASPHACAVRLEFSGPPPTGGFPVKLLEITRSRKLQTHRV